MKAKFLSAVLRKYCKTVSVLSDSLKLVMDLGHECMDEDEDDHGYEGYEDTITHLVRWIRYVDILNTVNTKWIF